MTGEAEFIPPGEDVTARMEIPLPRVTLWRVLIEPYMPPEMTEGGIALANQALEDSRMLTNFGKLVGIGDQAFKAERYATAQNPELGDWVIFASSAGVKLRMKNGRQLLVMNDDNILGVVSDPEHYQNLV